MNYKKDKSYIAQRLEYKDAVDYIEELEQQIEDLQQENEELKKRNKILCKGNLRIDVLYSAFIPDDVKLVVMTKEDYEDINSDYQTKILKAIKLLQKYNNKEANYYAPVQEVLDILGGDE